MNDQTSNRAPAPISKRAEIDAFLEKVRAPVPSGTPSGAHGRLIFALDATASRQPTWDTACELQAEMFQEVAAIGGLDVQLVYFRGVDECRASRWVSDGRTLADLMAKIKCRTGFTQISKMLTHARQQNDRRKVQALVFVGDAMEESSDALCGLAGELGLRGIPVFVFQEGDDPAATKTFREIARLAKGAALPLRSRRSP
jgi:hypothetical protein